jgi:biotin carboxyl carrier protein
MRYVALIAGRTYMVEVAANGHTRSISLDDQTLTVDWQVVGGESLHAGATAEEPANHLSLLIGDRSYEAYVRALPPESSETVDRVVEVMIGGIPYTVTVRDERSQALASLASGSHLAGDALIRAPMPGLVANVLATEGAEVKRGQTVVVLEAMKMENDLTAPRPGLVKAIKVVKGQTVNQGDVLAIVGDPADAQPTVDDEE